MQSRGHTQVRSPWLTKYKICAVCWLAAMLFSLGIVTEGMSRSLLRNPWVNKSQE
jgi:hypothetical protein